ncbi:MAG TPA: hypothetical protein VF698_19595, partial [Thermoanaerobaculia bacterium]
MRVRFATCLLILSATAFAAAAQVAPQSLDATFRAARNLIEEGNAADALAMLGAASADAKTTRAKAR